MRKFLVAIACVAIGLLASLGFSAVGQTHPATSVTPTEVTQTRPATSDSIPDVAQARPATPAPRNQAPNTMMSVDRQFVLTAAEAGLANIAMGELALQKSTSPQVKQFAQAEIAEQQQLKQALSQVAPRLGVSLPTAPGPRYQALAAKLAQLSGEQFNRAYLHEGGVNAHLENAATFQREAQFGQDAGVVAIANRSLPTIQNHFTTASQLTDYRFAQISQRFSTPTAPGTPQGNMSPRTPSAPVAPAAPAVQ